MQVSILSLADKMARHAQGAHQTIGDNLARIDIPGAARRVYPSFSEFLDREFKDPVEARASRQTISLDTEMSMMAQNTARHDASVAIWRKSLDLLRIAGGAPR